MSIGGDELEGVLGWPPPLGLVWLVVPFVGLLLRVTFAPIRPHDYWWSVTMGRVLAETGTLPAANLFVYTFDTGAPFVDQPWLAQWWLYRLYDWSGHAGPYLFRNGLAALTFGGLLVASLRGGAAPRYVGAVGMVVAVVSAGLFSARTQLFAFPCYVLLLVVVLGVADERLSDRWLFGLVPLTAIWANLHGSFVLAPAIVVALGCSLALESWWWREGVETILRYRRWGWAFGGTLLAGIATPWGPEVYRYVVELSLVSDVSSTVTEWQPPDPTTAFGAFAVVGVVSGWLLLALRGRRLRLHEAVLMGATGVAALSAKRSLFWWAAAALLVLPPHLQHLLDDGDNAAETTQLQGVIHASIVILGLVVAVVAQPGAPGFRAGLALKGGEARRTPPGEGLLHYENATGLLRTYAERDVGGRLFHDQAIGGLVEYYLGMRDGETETVAFVDQRMGLMPSEVWDEYMTVSNARDGWKSILEKYEVDGLVVQPDEQWRLIQKVEASSNWRLAGVDEGHLWYQRAETHSTASRTQPNTR